MKEGFFRLACRKLGFAPTVDGFSSQETKRCEVWWGPGSPYSQDAFTQCWSGHHLWLNPPFSRLMEVVRKIRADNAHGLLVMPDWAYRRWHKQAMLLSRGALVFPKGTKLFELPGRPNSLKGTLWPTRAVLLCGHSPKCQPVMHCPSVGVPRKRVRFNLR